MSPETTPSNTPSADSGITRTHALALAQEKLLERARKNNDGESLPEELLRERAKIIESLGRAIDAWVIQNIPENTEFSQDSLGKVVQYLGETQQAHLDALIAGSDNIEHYRTRPNIKIYEGVEKLLPDIWLLGWRENEKTVEATDIHDHVSSEAAFHVYRGCVDEIIYTFDTPAWGSGKTELGFKKTVRGLRRGSTATIPAPYIHIVSDHRDEQPAVTIHSYYPPLREMNFYDEKGDMLVRKGSWKETGTILNCGSCAKEAKR